MKTLVKTLAFFTIFAAFLACDPNDSEQSDSSDKMPAMSEKVISYQKFDVKSSKFPINIENIDSVGEPDRSLLLDYPFRIPINDRYVLKQWFPHILGTELENPECNYFAVLLGNAYPEFYYILQDTTLYEMEPEYKYSRLMCAGSECKTSYYCEADYNMFTRFVAILVCDDETGTLKNGINLSERKHNHYTVPGWDCRVESSEDRYPYF